LKNNIAAIRKNKGISQKELAEQVGIGNDWLCDIEKGKGTPSLALAKTIAEKLGVSMKDIFLD
jgi:DNA-binding XRE family transcriptional regulator